MGLTATQVAQARVAVEGLMGDVISVETYSGDGAYGPVYAAAQDVTCNVDTTRRLVRDSDGDEALSELSLAVRSSDATKFTPESRVTVDARTSTVLAVSPKTYNGQIVYVKVVCS